MHDDDLPMMHTTAEPKKRGRKKKEVEQMPMHEAEAHESHTDETESTDDFDAG